MSKTSSPSEVDFWMEEDQYSSYVNESKSTSQGVIFTIDMIRLASVRRSISNFVKILTRQSIPVYFHSAESSFALENTSVSISAQINSKHDFDVAVGLALHEGAHILLSDINVIKIAYANIPKKIFDLSDSKKIKRHSIESFIKSIINIIEDRYIDDYVFREAPGYRGYYVSLYNNLFNHPEIDDALLSDNYRYPSLASYEFRIMNLTNVNTDLMSLPRLDEIAKTIDLINIKRLTTTKERIQTAFRVVEIVLECVDVPKKIKEDKAPKKIAEPSDYFDFGDSDIIDGKKEDISTQMVEEMSNIINDKPQKSNENHDAVNKISLSDNIDNYQALYVVKQKEFLRGVVEKESLSPAQKGLLDLIEKHGIRIVQTPLTLPDNIDSLKVDCIVVDKMSRDLITNGQEIFPLCGSMGIGNVATPREEMTDAVNAGIRLGCKLGRRLQIRNEQKIDKIFRKTSGHLNKRQLHEAAFDASDLFYNIKIEEYKQAVIHITIDASSSMNGEKWIRTMTSVVAICKAASTCHNIHVTVSFRTTHDVGKITLPYIIMAYDSKRDKFSKIKKLFPYLMPNGCTPEGLAFSSIMNLFEGITPDEEDRYMFNLSDGEPYYVYKVPGTDVSIEYNNETGVLHTKSQIDKIRKKGVKVLSYFIESNSKNKTYIGATPTKLKEDFKRMYGKDAQFINVENVGELASTINRLFINK